MRRTLTAACAIAGLSFAGLPAFAMAPIAGSVSGLSAVLVQDRSAADFAALDARLESAAITAALIRAYHVVVIMAEQNLGLMSVITKLIPRDPDAPSQLPGKQAVLEKEAEIRGAMDTATESYLRLIGEIENSSSMEDIGARAEVVERAMGARGQGSIKAALPMILLHIKLIHAHAAPSRETILKDMAALATR